MKLLNTDQAAEYMRISPRTLQDWRLSGNGPRFHKLGRLVRYGISEIDSWLVQNQHQNTTEVSLTEDQ